LKAKHTAFWKQYLDTLPADHPHHRITCGAWGFGDSPQLMDELGQLVVDGIKMATASLVKEHESRNEPVPPVGDVNIILNGSDEPICIIQTTEITVKPLNQVDERFAYDEGEGDRSLQYWQEAHERFFRRVCSKEGWEFSDELLVVFERFKVIYRP
jgi:uncharacterized protein YhfF